MRQLSTLAAVLDDLMRKVLTYVTSRPLGAQLVLLELVMTKLMREVTTPIMPEVWTLAASIPSRCRRRPPLQGGLDARQARRDSPHAARQDSADEPC